MLRGPALAIVFLAVPLLAFLAADAAALTVCTQQNRCTAFIQPPESQLADVYVDEAHPAQNFNTGDGSEALLVRAGTNQRAWTLVRFPLLEDMPRNASILSARIEFGYFGGTGPCDARPTSVIQAWELRQPFDEQGITWTGALALNRSLTAVANVSVPLPPSPGSCATTLLIENHPGPPPLRTNGPNDEEPPLTSGISNSIRKYYERLEPYHGHLIKDRDDASTPAGLPATQRFFSSADVNVPRPGSFDRRPMLRIAFDPNGPELRTLYADGQQFVNATSTRPVNLSFETFDNKGRIVNAWINATENFGGVGREVFNRSVFLNRSSVFLDVFRHRVWSNESLNLPNGTYTINAFALDDDGNLAYTSFRQVNITVENTPPYVNRSRDASGDLLPFLSGDRFDEGQTIEAHVNASDRSGIAHVTLQVVRAGEVLDNVSFQPVPGHVDANMSGDWSLSTRARWAGDLNVTIYVVDRAGNVNTSATSAVHVRDILPPVILEARVITPLLTPDGAIQEEGGSVAWEARAEDASPLVVTLRIDPPSGPSEMVTMARQGLTNLYRHEARFTQRGSYGGTIVARDPDDNTATRPGLGFVIQEALPPVIEDLRPPPGGVGTGHPNISAVVSDLNLDVSRITLEVRVPPNDFITAEATTSQVNANARRIAFTDSFFHDERVEARVRATDLLGRSAERVWSFTVDDRAPVTFLAPQGNFLAGNRTSLTGNTTLRIERSDEGSGMLATVLSVVNEDKGIQAANITITGSDPAFLNFSASPVFTGTGAYSVFFSSVDKAGNVEPVQRRPFAVDDTPPRVSVTFEPGELTARVQEVGVGIREVRARYWLSPGGQQGSTLMTPDEDRTSWQAQIPDGERGTQVLYAVEATDLLGNVGTAGTAASPLSSLIRNHKPLITLTPPNNSLVRGPVLIEWSAADKDADPVQTSLSVRPSTSTDARELAANRGESGSVTWDTTKEGDGVWVLTVTARDGFDVVSAESRVDVSNTDSKVVRFDAAPAEPGQPTVITATLYKPVRKAEAVVRRGPEEVARVPLRDDGNPPDRRAQDGVFTGQFTAPQAGDYRVDLEVVFDDGKLETKEAGAVARVQHAFPGRILHEPLLLLLVVGVPVAVVGFLVYRRYGPIRVRK